MLGVGFIVSIAGSRVALSLSPSPPDAGGSGCKTLSYGSSAMLVTVLPATMVMD